MKAYKLITSLFLSVVTSTVMAAESQSGNRKGAFTFDGTNIVGIQEAAKNLVIVPWKSRKEWVDLKQKSHVKRFPIESVNELDIDRELRLKK